MGVNANGGAILGAAVTCAVYLKRLKAIPGGKALVGTLCGYVGPVQVAKLFSTVAKTIKANTPSCTQLRYRVSWSSSTVASNKCHPLNKSWKW